MGEVFPKPIWFDDEHFLELEISFWGPKPTRWRLDKKIYEHEYSVTIADGHTKTKDRTGSQPGNKPDRKGGERPDGDNSGGSRGDKDPREVNHDRGGACREESREACAVYTCSRIEDPDPDDTNEETSLTPPKIGIMKIRLQVPSLDVQNGSTPERARLATTSLTALASDEIEALTTLSAARCSSTPTFFGWKQDKQAYDAGIPGGYILYILMESLPGVRVDNFLRDLGREERDELRCRFKEAWLECRDCGVISMDTAIRNLLWDKERKKCYILDFEIFRKPTDMDVWDDSLYLAWNLAWVSDGDPNDMETWEL